MENILTEPLKENEILIKVSVDVGDPIEGDEEYRSIEAKIENVTGGYSEWVSNFYAPEEHLEFNDSVGHHVGNMIYECANKVFEEKKKQEKKEKDMSKYDVANVIEDCTVKTKGYVDDLFYVMQEKLGIKNGDIAIEQVRELDDAMDKLVNIVVGVLDMQYFYENDTKIYEIRFNDVIEAHSEEEAIEILKGKIDSTYDIKDLFTVSTAKEI